LRIAPSSHSSNEEGSETLLLPPSPGKGDLKPHPQAGEAGIVIDVYDRKKESYLYAVEKLSKYELLSEKSYFKKM
jgi:hypothetical protein